MVNYANGKVYKIEPTVEHDKNDVYYGSTTKQYLSQRMENHRSSFNRKTGMCSSKILFEKFGVENCVIVLLESVDAKSNDELKAVEAKYIINNGCVNQRIPLRTQKQYMKIYYDDNTEKINEKIKQYRLENKDKINEYHKMYNNNNKDTINKKNKIYRDANKDKINERNRQYRLKQKEQAISDNN
jgi:hypothetical protein